MTWKLASFIFIPIIFFGCMAYHYKSNLSIPVISEEVPNVKVDLDEIHKEFDGSQR